MGECGASRGRKEGALRGLGIVGRYSSLKSESSPQSTSILSIFFAVEKLGFEAGFDEGIKGFVGRKGIAGGGEELVGFFEGEVECEDDTEEGFSVGEVVILGISPGANDLARYDVLLVKVSLSSLRMLLHQLLKDSKGRGFSRRASHLIQNGFLKLLGP